MEKKKIKVKLDVSHTVTTMTFDLEDLGMEVEEWNNLSDLEKTEILQVEVNNMPEQPFWVITTFNEL